MSEIVLVKFKFINDGKSKWIDWSKQLSKRADEVYETLINEGVKLEACFLSTNENACYYLMEAKNIKKAMEIGKLSDLPIDLEHKNIRKNILSLKKN